MEVPVRKLLLGMPADQMASPDAMTNPGSLDVFLRHAVQLNASRHRQLSGQ